jgi:hypothetical protein
MRLRQVAAEHYDLAKLQGLVPKDYLVLRRTNFWVNACRLTVNAQLPLTIPQTVQDLTRMLVTTTANVNAPKNKKNAPAGESGNQRQKRRKEKVIRLDDLIPKQDVTGGHQLLFGAPETKQTLNNPTKQT